MKVFMTTERSSEYVCIFNKISDKALRKAYITLYNAFEGSGLELFLLKTCEHYREYRCSLDREFGNAVAINKFYGRDESALLEDLMHRGSKASDTNIMYMNQALELITDKLKFNKKLCNYLHSDELKRIRFYVKTTEETFKALFELRYNLCTERKVS